jgi:LssY C-terminus
MFPEPEIYLPRGSDLKIELTEAMGLPTDAVGPMDVAVPDPIDKALMEFAMSTLPERTTTRNGELADIVNVALVGSQGEMDAAFHAAGWKHGDPTSTRSVLRQTHAFFSFNNYASAPISTQLADGKPVDATWEKSLNSYEKREHLRVWGRNGVIEGRMLWLGAMTRETGASLSLRRRKFIHHIDADMDEGRSMVVRDLNLAGCVAAVYYLRRPKMAQSMMNSTGDPMQTDGSVAVVELKNCENPVFEQTSDQPAVKTRPHSNLARYLRMQVLSFRSDLIRANVVYGAFDLTRMAIRARRHRAEKMAIVRKTEPKTETPTRVALPW